MKNLFAFCFLFCFFPKSWSSNDPYGEYRDIFASLIEPFHIDKITSQLFNQMECTKYSGINCNTCLNSHKLQNASIIGNIVSSEELSKYSVIAFCYLLDFKNFCHENSTPNYEICYNYVTKNGSINSKTLQYFFDSKISTIYRTTEYFNSTGLSNYDDCIDPYQMIRKHSKFDQMFLNSSEEINALFSEIVFKLFRGMKIGCDLPYQNWFVDQLFNKNYDKIDINELRDLMTQLNLYSPKIKSKRRPIEELQKKIFKIFYPSVRTKRSFEKSFYEKCYSPEDLVEIFSLRNSTISKFEFHSICPSLIYMSSKSLCDAKPDTKKNEYVLVRESSAAEKYGYGSIAIIIVSLLALLGIILIPCFNKSIYEDILMALTSLAIGTLLSDAMLHILPEVLGVEDDDGQDPDVISVPDFAIKICGALFALYVFWLLETLVHHFSGRKTSNGHGHGHSHGIYIEDQEIQNNINVEKNEVPRTSIESVLDQTSSNHHLTGRPITQNQQNFMSNLKKIKATGWMILLGDAIHNFADGMAVGASFSQSIKLGVSTTIAVICHEVPHELGNYAVLVKSGFSHVQALLFNLLSASTCLIGFYVGVSVSTNPEVSKWIFTITAGMFLYISLVDLLPSVMSGKEWSWKMFFVCNAAMIIGFLVMFLLVIFEDHIKI